MSQFLNKVLKAWFPQSEKLYARETGKPHTYLPVNDPRVRQADVFDPALCQFPHGLRPGEPTFADPALARAWRAARRRVIDHVLRIVAGGPFADDLVLRGSLLLTAWLGPAAREPGDMDFVVTPQARKVDDGWTHGMFLWLLGAVLDHADAGGGVELLPGEALIDDIWTYDRVPGRRVVFPWRAADLPRGTVQLDFVFNEALPLPPVRVAVPALDGPPTVALAAPKELSLAWKLMWLESDIYPQGKDLYDATLLAEQTALPRTLLERVLHAYGNRPPEPLTAEFPLHWVIDWDEFAREWPGILADPREWQPRLAAALRPTFAIG